MTKAFQMQDKDEIRFLMRPFIYLRHDDNGRMVTAYRGRSGCIGESRKVEKK